MVKILFVCLGNICRSSTAEGIMLHLIKEAGLEQDFVIPQGFFHIIRESFPTVECVLMLLVGDIS